MSTESQRMSSFAIAISTYNDRINQAVQLAATLKAVGDVIIFHQVTQDCVLPDIPKTIGYFQLKGKGVAKSRNAALANVNSRFLWFLDDDVSVDVDRAKAFMFHFLNEPMNVNIMTVGVLDEMGRPRKRFSSRAFNHNRISILSVGTIEIIVNREILVANNCYFPEDMGAGSGLPIADEPVFLANCLKAGLSARFIPAYFVSHPSESSGSQFANISSSRSRGVAFRRIFGVTLGWILLTSMYLKNLLIGRIPLVRFLAIYYYAVCGLIKNS